MAQDIASVGPVIWYLFFACLLLLLPFVASAGLLVREFAVFTGISTVAMSLDLLFVAVLAIDPFASLSLAIFLALALYAGARRWLPDPSGEHPALGAGRLFERLYRRVREIEDRPQDWPTLLPELLRELFEPLEVQPVAAPEGTARVLGDGAALLVPGPGAAAWLLRFAGRGRRIFTRDDAKLADGVVEQVRRALAQDHAVERGRSEERARIAQDLHDDIGARLLTLMYQAPSSEIEDYIRHTLKDLKTLTRGLAASEHRLSFAAAEWKADIAQRLGAAQIELAWSLRYDRDLELGVVQWSALTRVLRELVSNVIQHSAATHVDIDASVEGGRLRLRIADDGIGRNPQAWSHGLGLGGVRKRVKQLGGDVHWAENGPAGIVCTVIVPQLGERAT
jgi:signal transduction histidine kinase